MEINIEELTTSVLKGTGTFDKIMSAMEVRLEREYAKSRLKGPDYAKVYLGTFEASLLNSIQFVLHRQEADKKAELLVAQTSKTKKEELLLDEHILIAKEDLKLKAKELELIEIELKLKAQELLIRAEELKIKQQELLIAIEKLELTKVQVWTEKAKVSNDVTIVKPPIVLSGLMGGQIRKIDNEGDLLAQKTITEKGQVEDLKTGTIGKQQLLLVKQKDGFDRDAEQKAAKIYSDIVTTRLVSTDGTKLTPAGFGDQPSLGVSELLMKGLDPNFKIDPTVKDSTDGTT